MEMSPHLSRSGEEWELGVNGGVMGVPCEEWVKVAKWVSEYGVNG